MQPDFMYVSNQPDGCTLVLVRDDRIEPRGSVVFDPDTVRKDGRDFVYRHDRNLSRLKDQLQFVWGEEEQPTQVYRSTDLGKTLTRLAPLPKPDLPIRFTSMDGTLLAFDEWRSHFQGPNPPKRSHYYIWGPEVGWTTRKLPAGFQANGISRTPDGTIYVAGGQLSYPERSDKGCTDESLFIDRGVRRYVVRPTSDNQYLFPLANRYSEHFDGVDSSGTPLVLWGIFSDGGPEVFISDDKRWNSAPIKSRHFSLHREWPGVVTFYYLYHPGMERYRTRDCGRTWETMDLEAAIWKTWPNERPVRDLFIFRIDTREAQIVMKVCGYDDHQTYWFVFTSDDDGQTFCHRPLPDSDRGDVCLLP